MFYLAVGLAVAAALDEITQPIFSRHAEMLDWVFDCIGIGLGMTAVLILLKQCDLGADGSTKLGVQNDEPT